MYKIDIANNNIIKLDQPLFREIKVKERQHLQEWIAKKPEVLGEELLIIQKEFSGFNDTNERLDLLALDKQGNLVIIENKLDDTGRNVVWQALKYTSYCSTLTTDQIIKLYQDYLDAFFKGESAKESINDFLENEDELFLNRNDQRIIFVANNYRKEVTSTVLWLLNHDVQIQCFRATPYSMGSDLFLQIEQIIPLPETQEYMIDAKQKDKEEKVKSTKATESETKLVEFWSLLKERLARKNLNYLDSVSSKPSWSIGFWKWSGKFAFCIGKDSIRVELYFSDDQTKNKFDSLLKHKDEIERKFDGAIVWQRLNSKKASRIKYEIPFSSIKVEEGRFFDELNKEAYISWYIDAMKSFYAVIYPVWENAQKEID